MFRTTAVRAIPSSLTSLRTTSQRASFGKLVQQAAFKSSARQIKISPILALTTQQPVQKSLVRYASSKVVLGRDNEREKSLQNEKVFAMPELVTSSSSSHPVISGEVGGQPEQDQDVDMMAGVKSDFVSILVLGFAGAFADFARKLLSILSP